MKKEVDGINASGEFIKISTSKLYFRPTSYAVIKQDDKIVLLRSRLTGKYILPGGGIDLGETMEEGLRREVKEETGLEVLEVKPFMTNDVFFESHTKDTFHSIQFIYLCTVKTTQLIDDDKVDDSAAEKPRWVTISELKPEDFNNHGNDFKERFLEKIKTLE